MTIWQRWKQTAIHNKALVVTSVLVAFGTLFYAGAAALQLWMMDQSGRHTDEQIGRVIGNVNWMARSMDQSSKDALAQIKEQTAIQDRSARAAEKAADIANNALHISERAYLFPKGVQFDATTSNLFLPIANVGHIPAKNVHVIVHLLKETRTPDGGEYAQYNWLQRDFTEIWSGDSLSVGEIKIDLERTRKGLDRYTFGITLEYNDGFPDSKPQTKEDAFCMSHLENDHIGYGPCMVTNTLDMMKRADQYPNPKYQIP